MLKKIFAFIVIGCLAILFNSCVLPTGEESGKKEKHPEDYEYVTPITDELKLTESYEGKDFIKDGIGEVTVSQYVDGDTAIFKCAGTKGTFTVRFAGINTPESTYKVEPWGFAASKFTKNALKSASKIVLECDDINNRMDSTGKRYLAWVWVIDEFGDSRLLNLDLVENALAQGKSNSDNYREAILDAVKPVSNEGCRIYGETDPDYDYSKESTALSLREIREQYSTINQEEQDEYKGKKVVISGVVTRQNGINSCYIQQYDEESNEYYGVYVYGGFTPHNEFKVGNSVVIEGKIGYYYGSLQITDVTSIKLREWADTTSWETQNYSVNKQEITNKSLLSLDHQELFGRLVTLYDVEITGGSNPQSETNAFTLHTSDGIDIRVDANIVLKDEQGERITKYEWFNGKKFNSVTVIVSYYDYNTDDARPGNIQLMLTSMNDIDFAVEK